jgi:crossover junction endodeoxyribonuclease RuvC
MSDYKDRLDIAKKSYIATDGPGEASVRLLWTFKQLAHSYTNCDVENLRYLYPKLKKEAPFYGKNVQSMLKLGRAQGVAMAAAMTMGLEISEYAPKKIKQSVTGNGNASKEQVAAMLNSILKVKIDTPNLDATDALGVAICHYYQTGGVMSGQKKYSGWDSFLKDNPGKKFKL